MKKSIEIKKTAHYYLQYPDHPIQSILFVLHGYAQLAEEFILDFKSLQTSDVLVIAPEALSKFYNKERKPVANWMTSHEREDEIIDYINYLNDLFLSISRDHPDMPFNVLGFSQGVSTLLRWITHSSILPKNIHLCAGTIPPELNKEDFGLLKNSSFHYYYGSEDKLLKKDNALKQMDLLNSFNLKVNPHYFLGRHEVPQECINRLS